MQSPENLNGVVCSGESETPYISVVATARNDNHGGNLLGRMQVFVDAWINQCKRHNLSAELVIVEWNPPSEKPGLAEALRWPSDTGPCQVRIIQVPAELHRRFRHAEALPLYQMIAKNVGIRRARGEFILVTNIDVVFSSELVRFLAGRKLKKGRIYRIDRHDAASDVPVNGTLDEQLEYCRAHVIRLCARHGIFKLSPEGLPENLPNDIARPDSGIYFGAGWFEVELYVADHFRWIENDAELFLRVPPGGGLLGLEVEPGPGVGPPPQPLQILDHDGKLVAEWQILGRTSVRINIPPAASGMQRIRLHVPDGGLPVPHDPRIMNFRFFRCDWVDAATLQREERSLGEVIGTERHTLARLVEARLRAGVGRFLMTVIPLLRKVLRLLTMRGVDIFEGAAEFQIGTGWHELERHGGATFRWASNNSELRFRFNDGTTTLALIIEPGPDIRYQPFDLVVKLLDGSAACRERIDGLTYVEVPLPIEPGEPLSVFLNAEGAEGGGGSGIATDSRNLTFRVFACGRGTVKGAPPLSDAFNNGPWATRTVGTRPVEIDWQVQLWNQAREIAEMGKPKFLHLYACGDFQLMARENWFDVRGYAELDQFSFHLDSILSYAANHLGIEEEVLSDPMRIYHIEHGIGSGWTPEGHNTLMDRINKQGIENITFTDLALMVAQMRRLHAPMIFNLDNWGMAELNLTEIIPHASLADKGAR
jgi:hypothetical protein